MKSNKLEAIKEIREQLKEIDEKELTIKEMEEYLRENYERLMDTFDAHYFPKKIPEMVIEKWYDEARKYN